MQKVFISWSGERAHIVAKALEQWLTDVLRFDTFLSSSTPKGAPWWNAIHDGLEEAVAGIVIVTPESLESEWVLYEAGTLVNAVKSRDRALTLLVGLDHADVTGPLQHFQHTTTEKDDFMDLAKRLNDINPDPLPADSLGRQFTVNWPLLAKTFEEAIEYHEGELRPPSRSLDSMMEEVLETVRQIANRSVYNEEETRIRREVNIGIITKFGIHDVVAIPEHNEPFTIAGITNSNGNINYIAKCNTTRKAIRADQNTAEKLWTRLDWTADMSELF